MEIDDGKFALVFKKLSQLQFLHESKLRMMKSTITNDDMRPKTNSLH